MSAGSVPNRGHCPGLDLHSCPHVGGKVGGDDIISLIVYHYRNYTSGVSSNLISIHIW